MIRPQRLASTVSAFVLTTAALLLSQRAVAQSNDEATWLRELEAPNGTARDRALAELPKRLLEPGSLERVIGAAATSPEVEMRLRAAVAAAPYLMLPLAHAAAGSDSRIALRARALLVEALTFEVARRAPADRLLKRTERTRLFMTGEIVGALPPLTSNVPFERGVDWLGHVVPWSTPLALDPELAGDRLAPLVPAEWWPSTAGGLLKRWLAQRALGVIDLGIVTVITTSTEVSVFARADREAEESSRRGIGFERRAASWLTERLVDTSVDPAAAAARFRLWLALGLAPKQSVAGAFGDLDDRLPEIAGLIALSRSTESGAETGWIEVLRRASPEMQAALGFELGCGPRSTTALRDALSAAGFGFEARYLEAKGRVDRDRSSRANSGPVDGATAAAGLIAALQGSDATSRDDWLRAMDARGPLLGREECWSVGCAFARSTLAWEPAVGEVLRASPDPATRWIGWFAAGCATGRGDAFPTGKAGVNDRDGFALGLAFGEVGRVSPERAAMIVELSTYGFQDRDVALLAAIRSLPSTKVLERLPELRRVERTRMAWARAVVHRGVMDLLEDDDRLATRILFELRRVEDPSRELGPLYEDASAAFGSEDRGRVALVSPIDRLWLTRSPRP